MSTLPPARSARFPAATGEFLAMKLLRPRWVLREYWAKNVSPIEDRDGCCAVTLAAWLAVSATGQHGQARFAGWAFTWITRWRRNCSRYWIEKLRRLPRYRGRRGIGEDTRGARNGAGGAPAGNTGLDREAIGLIHAGIGTLDAQQAALPPATVYRAAWRMDSSHPEDVTPARCQRSYRVFVQLVRGAGERCASRRTRLWQLVVPPCWD